MVRGRRHCRHACQNDLFPSNWICSSCHS